MLAQSTSPRGWFETLYAGLLILTIEELFSSINALPKGVSNSSLIMHLQVEWV
jgi:hypothetical protein